MKPIYLVITPFFPTQDSFRGPYIYDQVKAIAKNSNFNVIVLKGTSCFNTITSYEYDGIKVHYFKIYDLPSDIWPGSNTWLSIHSLKMCLKRIGVKYSDIAVVHSHVTCNARFANFIKKKNPQCLTVLQHHGYDVLGLLTGRFHKKKWHQKQAIRYGIRECNKIDLHLGVSKETLRYLEKFNGIKLKDKYVLYNGVDKNKFFNTKSNDIESTKKRFTIGCVANFWELKDQITLIKAVETLINKGEKNILVKFVGTGYTRRSCENYILENQLEQYFEFNNEVDHTQLNAFYNTLDLFVLPSYWDSFGCVYTEAYACGVPFMTSRGTGVAELIPEQEQHKWVINAHDYETLAKNIKRVMKRLPDISIKEIQPLNSSIDINQLIKGYLKYIRI